MRDLAVDNRRSSSLWNELIERYPGVSRFSPGKSWTHGGAAANVSPWRHTSRRVVATVDGFSVQKRSCGSSVSLRPSRSGTVRNSRMRCATYSAGSARMAVERTCRAALPCCAWIATDSFPCRHRPEATATADTGLASRLARILKNPFVLQRDAWAFSAFES